MRTGVNKAIGVVGQQAFRNAAAVVCLDARKAALPLCNASIAAADASALAVSSATGFVKYALAIFRFVCASSACKRRTWE